MPRGAKPEGVTIGFLGTGTMEVDPATDLIEEWINETVKPDEPARFVFPLTTDEFSDSLNDLARMARSSKITYEVITNPDDKNRRAHVEVANGAAKQYHVTDVWTQMEAILVDAPQSALMVLWDDQRDDELNEIVGKFVDAGIKVMDLTDHLRELSRDDAEGEAEAEGETEEEAAEDQAEAEASEDEDEAEPQEDDAEAIAVYSRAQLEKMSHAQVKDIALNLGLAPRKARENMIIGILEAQGGPQAAAGGSVEADVVDVIPLAPQAQAAFLEGFRDLLDGFGQQFFDGLDNWLTKLGTTLEGVNFNLTPEEPMEPEPEPEPEPEERPTRRRLARAR